MLSVGQPAQPCSFAKTECRHPNSRSCTSRILDIIGWCHALFRLFLLECLAFGPSINSCAWQQKLVPLCCIAHYSPADVRPPTTDQPRTGGPRWRRPPIARPTSPSTSHVTRPSRPCLQSRRLLLPHALRKRQ